VSYRFYLASAILFGINYLLTYITTHYDYKCLWDGIWGDDQPVFHNRHLPRDRGAAGPTFPDETSKKIQTAPSSALVLHFLSGLDMTLLIDLSIVSMIHLFNDFIKNFVDLSIEIMTL